MRVVLVSYMRRHDAQIPIGLLTLAEIARREGISDVRVLDLPERGDENDFIHLIRDCDVAGFSSICSTYNQTIRLCERLRAAAAHAQIVLGGPQASLTAAESLLAFPFIDLIFRGEAENSWPQFLRNVAGVRGSWADVPGIVWRERDKIHSNPTAPIVRDLGTLPFPALDLYDFADSAPVTPVEIGRGCPFACSFCATGPFFRRNFRLKPVARILDEMDRLNEQYGSSSFYFVQDSFSVKRSFVRELCAALKAHDRPYLWYCSARTDLMTTDLAMTMKDAGCRGIYFGLETGSQRMQQVINKRLDIEDALDVIGRSASHGLQVTTSMIIGFPDETAEDLRDTLRVFLDLKAAGHALVQLHVLAPMLGSALSREGHALRYDGMPSDFSDTASLLDEQDHELIRCHPTIFASFWYYPNPVLSRQRFLYLAHVLGFASVHFPNTLCLAARRERDGLVEYLLNGPMPEMFYSNKSFPAPLERTIELTRDVFMRFITGAADDVLAYAVQYDFAYCRAATLSSAASVLLELPESIGTRPGRMVAEGLEENGDLKRYIVEKQGHHVEIRQLRQPNAGAMNLPNASHEIAAVSPGGNVESGDDAIDPAELIERVCSSCGECCFEPGGILAGRDEWLDIRKALAEAGEPELEAIPLQSAELLRVQDYREVPWCSRTQNGKAGTRRACPALKNAEHGWRCCIEGVKPAGCVAYPLKLMLREQATGAAKWLISLEFDGSPDAGLCPLETLLRRSPGLFARYCEYVGRRIGAREGTFALAEHNRANCLQFTTSSHRRSE
jgi:radical SAM superfamily enzyme YgiQ (UPF0313 family)/Fe-S-cluster containining protein